ncbi:hypothetical protein [Sphingomonas aracearum]|nr:hypothetical protein [Sphingomonas aracearum]
MPALRPFALGFVALALVGAIGWFTQAGDAADTPETGIAVVAAAPAAPHRAPPSPAPSPTASPRDAALAEIRATYPLLRDPVLSCDAMRCALTGLILPPTDQAYLDKRQEMLLGGLAAILAAHGYRTEGPVKLDEIDSNTFRLRAEIPRVTPPAAPAA